MKGTGAKRNVCRGSCVSTGAKFPVALVESAPMAAAAILKTQHKSRYHNKGLTHLREIWHDYAKWVS